MKTVRYKLDADKAKLLAAARIDRDKFNATTEEVIACQKAEDNAEAQQDAAKFARRVREQLGLSQADFASSINVSLDTIRNWEQGKRCPTGAAKALLKVIHKAPKAALAALR
jgi:putative transcriptional regulator